MTSGCKHKSRRISRRQAQRGLSLVELLVVMALAAMVAGVVVINAPPGRTDARRAAEALAARLDFAAQDAVTRGAVLGMRLDDEGYAFFRYQRGEWKPETTAQMKADSFPPEFSVDVSREAPAKRNEPEEKRRETETVIRPDLRFMPTGETTPVTVMLQDRREIWRVTLDGAGHVEVSNVDGA
ncbi:MAG: type II secretion system protein GspH [Parvularcula sp.]|nr:type II secretion system protein GspH [Parvularcula sp.]